MESLPRGGHDETGPSHLPKRQKIHHSGDVPASRHGIYTVAWICALSIEMAAARAVLDNIHESLPALTDDSNTYILGDIQGHNVAIACLPTNQYGIINAANVATNIKRTFPAIRVGLMVGIGGGVPSKADIRLGDVVVGTRVMQVDLGKIIHGDQELERTAIPRIPHQSLGTAVTTLRAKHELEPSRIPSILQEKLEVYGYGCPGSPDRLFQANYHHKVPAINCDECDDSKLVLRSVRVSTDPVIHYGAIASGSQVIKNSVFRDEAARQLNVICFEMEAAGLMDIIPCLPIRGICDYSDSHKSKEWQRYAAATAAAYARELLEELPVTEMSQKEASIPITDQIPSQNHHQLLLDSLRFEKINNRRSNVRTAHAKTCQWFLSHPAYKAWVDPANLTHHGFLWICGKPGAGKSTIMKYVHSNMKKRARRKDVVTASFFFNARGDILEKSVIGMYRSLLLQLLEGFPDLQTVLNDPDLIPTQGQNSCPSLNVLKDLLHKAVSLLGQRSFTCFIDALDECDEQQVRDMIEYFEDLAEQSTAKRLQICFSSRHYPYIMIRHGTRLILEDQPGHAEDLQAFIGDKLRTDDTDIAEKLLQKSAGVFMWVVLVVEILNREIARGAMSLDRKLEELPSGLSNLFKERLKRDDENMEGLLLCFLWILCAKRPLRPEEFYHALWSGLSLKSPSLVDTKIPDASIHDTSKGLPRSHRYVISCSKGLAEITKSDKPSVQFIHESVRDFLIKDRGLYELWPQLGLDWKSPSHERLKDCCNAYMNHVDVREVVSKLTHHKSFQPQNLNNYPFLEYANQNILYHANVAAKVIPQDEFLTSLNIINWVKVNNLFEKSQIRSYTPNASLLYILTDKGCPDLIRTRLQNFPEIHIFGERYKYPLFSALARGDKASVAALLNLPSTIYNGVDITDGLNHRKDLMGYEKRTPLFWAAHDGRAAIVKLLIERGEDVNAKNEGETLVSIACRNEHTAVVNVLLELGADVDAHTGEQALLLASGDGYETLSRLLIEQGANVNATGLPGLTPLVNASRSGHEAIVKLLIEHGAGVNTTGFGRKTPLSEALANGHEAIVKLLIEQGADFNTDNGHHGQTLLSQASRIGSEATVKLLIEHGASVDTTGFAGLTPLLEALAGGHEAIVKLLIAQGADIQAYDENGRTPLSKALSWGHVNIMKLLIEQGADIDAINPDGQTLLSKASIGGNQLSVIHLIDQGADTNATNQEGQSPISLAVRHGHMAIVRTLVKQVDTNIPDGIGRSELLADLQETLARTPGNQWTNFITLDEDGLTTLSRALTNGQEALARFLIEQGADVNATGLDQPTPLSRAAAGGYEAIGKLLIEHGADTNARDRNGWTPLVWALRNGCDALVKLLIERGARTEA